MNKRKEVDSVCFRYSNILCCFADSSVNTLFGQKFFWVPFHTNRNFECLPNIFPQKLNTVLLLKSFLLRGNRFASNQYANSEERPNPLNFRKHTIETRASVFNIFPTVHAENKIGAMGSEIFLRGDDMYRIQLGETGLDRLKVMYSFKNQSLSPELILVIQSAYVSLLVGIFIGIFMSYRREKEEFIRQNKEKQYMTHIDAKKQFLNKVSLSIGRIGWMWGWRLGTFTGLYMLISVSGAVYKNSGGLTEHIAAGAIVGSLWKMNMGLRAMVVGGVTGSVLGVFAGILTAGSMWLTGVSVNELRYWHHNYWQKELQLRQEEMKKAKLNDNALLREHDKMQEEANKTKISGF